MEIQASAKFVRISPKKVRALLVPLRGMRATDALTNLRYHRSKAAKLIYKLIHSAVSNAKNNYNFKEDNLKIKQLTADGGSVYKRYWLRSRGGADKLLKRTSHLQVTLAEIHPTVVKKPVAKPIPTEPQPPTGLPSTPPPQPGERSDNLKVSTPSEAPKLTKNVFKKIFTRRTTNK